MDLNQNIENEMDRKTLETTLMLIHKHTGITIHEYKKTMVQSRLRKRMRELQLNDYEGYIKHLQNNVEEIQNFVNLITTNETFFFRTERVWDYFKKEFLEKWTASQHNKMLKIWSAASSSGEEAYTTAILCEEHKEKKPSFQYKIFGTDISTKAMRAAQAGIYGERSVDLFKKKYPLLLNKYMLIEKDSYKAGDRIKANVSFTKHNLFQGLPAEEKFDLVFLRNVLIYFSPQDQERVLSVIEKNIHNGGILILGESETIRDLKQNFWHKSVLIYEKKGEGV